MKHCPSCSGEIQDAATRCRQCGRDVPETTQPEAVPPGARSFRTLTESDARLLKVGEVVYLQSGGVVTQKARPLLEEKLINVIDLNPRVAEPARERSTETSPIATPRKPNRAPRLWTAAALLVLSVVGFKFLGFYSIQPIGAVPQGQTWLVVRSQDEAFFESADARCLRRIGNVSLLARGVALAQAPKDRILIRMPYWRFAYLRSTGGQEFDR